MNARSPLAEALDAAPEPSPTAVRLRTVRAKNPGSSTAYNKRWEASHPEKRRAHKVVENALLSGRLVRAPCERCGSAEVEAHHEDYDFSLHVLWLCRTHHLARHRELRGGAEPIPPPGGSMPEPYVARRAKRKLTPEDALAIRGDPRGCKRLARAFGVSPGHIMQIHRGLAWKTVGTTTARAAAEAEAEAA